MNKELASVLKDMLVDLPFLDKVAGLVQVVEEQIQTENGSTALYRLPVSTDVSWADCSRGVEEAMMPDSSLKGLLYFEDYGTRPDMANRVNQGFCWQSSLRLVCWINRELIGGTYDEITVQAIVAIMHVICDKRINKAPFKSIFCQVSNIPPRDKAIFSKYSYPEPIVQYLMAPFEFFALDLAIKFHTNYSCIDPLLIKPELCP